MNINNLKTINMSDFKSRLEVEKQELDEKIEKLTLFVIGESFDKIDKRQQGLLNTQLPIMRNYSAVLRDRLALLN
jgi:hypothetical protein